MTGSAGRVAAYSGRVPALQSTAVSRADLSDEAVAHLTALVSDWGIVADLGFSDLVLYLPTWNAGGYVAAAQVRPDTAPTRIPLDVVGTYIPRGRLPQVDRALGSGEVIRERAEQSGVVPVGREAIPVRLPGQPKGRPVAVLARYTAVRDRPLGRLEEAYLAAADAIAELTARGAFPPADGRGSPHRVGDGLLRIDPKGIVQFASPNAQSAMRAMGLTTPLVDVQMARVVARILSGTTSADQAVVDVATGATAGVLEVDSRSGTLSLRSIPLLAGEGAVVLLRDVSELRKTERALLSKEATIREVHHRVKNNLQTVASLLRLQARRMPNADSRHALLDAVARVTTIAVVHDTLAQEAGDEVDFDEVTAHLLQMAEDAAASQSRPQPARVRQRGRFGTLPAVLATPLAMALSELLLNAAEHADAGTIELQVERLDDELDVAVCDDGIGFDATATGGLGLQIVRTLVTGQIGGTLTWDETDNGTRASIVAQVP